MAQVAEHLVGRRDELGALAGMLDDLDRGRPGALALIGEPGIGKTRLLRELAALAESRGHLVLSGSASELERDLPFSVFVDALDEYVEGLDARLLTLDEDVQAELAHVLPSLSTLGGGRAVALQQERYRTYRAVRSLLELLARTRPLVLVLDDFHWADAASIELLGVLLRRRPAAVLVALGLRPRQLPERLSSALQRAYRAASLDRIELDALTPVEARELVGEAVDDPEMTVLFEASGGNPFYLELLARTLDRTDRRALADDAALADIGVPTAVAASLSDELGLLSDRARRVLQGAAVAGDPFEPELAAAAAGTSEHSTMDVLDELLRLDLIRATDVPRRFRFRHPLVRRAVYETTPGGWRLGAHERCAEALLTQGASAAARAHHVERYARQGDMAAIAVLREAGESAARLAPASAARWFAAALRLLPQTAPEQARVELLLARAGTLAATGHLVASHEALLGALTIVPSEAIVLRTTLTTACARIEHLLGYYEEARVRLVNALESLPAPVSPAVVVLMVELALNTIYRTKYDAVEDWARSATNVARQIGEPSLTALALAMLALAGAMAGEGERAQVAHSEAADLIGAMSDSELAERLDAAVWLAAAEVYLDRYREADAHVERALAVARATGQGDLLLFFLYEQGLVWYVQGRLTEATELLDGAIEAARVLGNQEALAWSLSNRAAVALASDDLDLALRSAEESVALTRGVTEGYVAAYAAVWLAATLLETGQPAKAADLLVTSTGGEEATLIPGGWRTFCFDLQTRCWLALGRREEAARAAARAEARAAAVQLPLASAWADRAAAAVAFDAGDASGAVDRALVSAVTAEAAGAPIEAALSRVLAGRALVEAGERDRAVAELQRAAGALDACGAPRYRQSAERELGKLGHRPHRRSRPGTAGGAGIASLTERELQVARLVVDRKTNPEIAAELFLSQKTVETHLRNIFNKLGVADRVALARAVERADRTAKARPA